MRNAIIVCIIFFLVLFTAQPGCCDGNPVNKFSRGLCNLVTFPLEINVQSVRIKNEYGSVAGMTYGIAKGLVMSVVRAIVGVYEIATFPIPYPSDYQPILKDPILLFPETAKYQESKESSLRGDAQKLLDTMGAAFDNKNAEGVVAVATPGARLEYLGGKKESCREWLARIQKEFADVQTMISKFTVESAVAQGDSIQISYTETHDYTLLSDPGHRYRSIGRWSATLIKAPGGWRIDNFKELSKELTRDGAAYNI